MKYFNSIAIAFLFSGCSLFLESPNENLISFHKINNNHIHLTYQDSSHGISEIYATKENDTLKLKIYASLFTRMDDYLICIPKDIKYICYGNKKNRIDEIPVNQFKANFDISRFKIVEIKEAK